MATTLLQLRDRILQRTDNQYTDGFVTNAEVNALINLHYKELYELLQFAGPHRVETEYTVDAATDIEADGRASLPIDVYSIMVVHRIEDDGSFSMLTRHDHRSRPRNPAISNCPAETYRVAGGMRLELDPIPASGEYVVTYIPVPPDLAADADTLDGVLGWEEFVVVAVALDIALKEAVDPGLIGAIKAQVQWQRDRIKTAAKNAEMTEAPRIVDVRSAYSPDRDTGHRGVWPSRWPWWF
jgi:hypothetical protein